MKEEKLNVNDIVVRLNFLNRWIKKQGYNKIEKALKRVSLNGWNIRQNTLRDKIYDAVSVKYNLSPHIIIHSKKRGAVTQARAMCILLFDRHLDYKHVEIARIFKRNQSLISRRIRGFDKAGETKEFGSQYQNQFNKIYANGFMDKFNEIDTQITEFKKQLITKNNA